MNEVRKTMILLRQDALERGQFLLAEIYGWSTVRLGREALRTINPIDIPHPNCRCVLPPKKVDRQ